MAALAHAPGASTKHFVAHQCLRIQPESLTLIVSAGKPQTQVIPLPDGTIVHGKIANQEAFDQTLKTLFAKPLPYQSLVLCIPEHQAVIRSTKLQQSATQDVHDAVLWQLQGYLPHSIDQMQIDWQIFESDPPILVQAVAMPHVVLQAYVQSVKQYPINLVSVDTPSMALLRINEGIEYPCICIDAENTATIAVLDQPQLASLTSVVPLASLTARVEEIKRYYALKNKTELSHIYIVGKNATEIVSQLGANSKTATLGSTPVAGILNYLLAEKQVTPPTDIHSLNLLPSMYHGDYGSASDSKQKRNLIIASAWSLLVINLLVGGGLGYMWWKLHNMQQTTATSNATTNLSVVRNLQSQVSAINTYGASRQVPAQIIQELLKLTDEQIKLNGIKMSPENKSVTINGSAESAATILNYKDRLSQSSLFTNVKLPLNIFEKTAPVTFTMTISWQSE